MIIRLLKLIFGKVIGLENIPKEKREEFWKKIGNYSIELAKGMSEGAARGVSN